MGTVNVTLGEDTRLNLILGQQLENAVTSVVFDFSAWQTAYGSGTLALSVQRPGDDQPYAVTMTTSGTDATWSVTNLDTAYKGVGHIQLTYTVGSAIKKSVVYKFTVYESLGANGEYPSPGQTWQEEIEDELADVKQDLQIETEQTVLSYPDASGHSLLTDSLRRFWIDEIPEDAEIIDVKLPIGNFGGGAYLNIEVWELSDDGTTLTRSQVYQVTSFIANTVLTVPINHKSDKKRYIAQFKYSVQAYYLSGQTGKAFYLASNTDVDTTSIQMSALGRYSNMYLVGDITYEVTTMGAVTNTRKDYIKVPIPWRHGAFDNSGNIYYGNQYVLVTDLYLPTTSIDYFDINTSGGYNAMISYYNLINGKMVFQVKTGNVTSRYTINKTYDYFVIRLIINWSTPLDPANGNTVIEAYKKITYPDIESEVTSIVPSLSDRKSLIGQLKRKNLDFISISHQGFSLTEVPNHNLLSGYVDASYRGFDYGETDVQLTSDNVLVCCHDATFVDGTTGTTITIANETLASLQTHNYYGGTIATFDDVVKTCKENGLGILIDQASPEKIPYCIPIITKYGMWKKTKWFVTYLSDYPNYAKEHTDLILGANPTASIYVISQFALDDSITFAKSIKTPYNEVVIHLPYTSYSTSALIDLVDDVGDELGFSVYTIDDLGIYKQYFPYVKAIISNQISTLDVLT